jgi:hypothetical protein
VANRWYVTKDGQVRGPFPEGALVQDRLVGRIGDADLVSPDQADWKPFASWPELAETLVSAVPPASGDGEDQWAAERNQARMRWADQRSGQDRRADAASSTGDANATEEQRRYAGTDRRGDPDRTAGRPKPGLGRTSRILGTELPIWVLVAGLAGLVLLIGLLVYLFGAVNPVRVRIL